MKCTIQERSSGPGIDNSGRRLPTVTATAKPLATPRIEAFIGGEDASGFNPLIASTRQPVIAARLRDEMSRLGICVMSPDETRCPDNEEALGWTEAAEIDELGHKLGMDLARHLDDGHRRLRRDAFDGAVPVAVQHGVADDQHARPGELFFARIHSSSTLRAG